MKKEKTTETKNSKNETEKALKKCFENVDEDQRQLALDTVDEYLYFLGEIEKLKPFPKIRVSSVNPAVQKITPAGKLIKEYSQVVDAKRATLLRILNKTESSAADDLAAMFAKFE